MLKSYKKPYVWKLYINGFTAGENFKDKHIAALYLGHKDFVCSWCNKAFGHLSTLQAKDLIHTGKLPFKK